MKIGKKMKVLQYIIIITMLLPCALLSAKTKKIIAGFDSLGQEEHLKTFSQNGLNTHFRSIRIASHLDLKLDSRGQVVLATPPEEWKSLINYCKKAEAYGVEVYFIAGFHREQLAQLENLGPYNKAVIQGPTRYHGPGEKPAPGPLEEKYWLGQLLHEAKFAAELSKVCPNVRGVLVDVEMYSGQIMWRTHCSFDDQTFRKVMDKIGERRPDFDHSKVPKDDRYKWLLKNKVLEEYFSIEEQLVLSIARRFRSEIDAINPDFELGILPYEANWFYDGWIKGLSTPTSSVLIGSESEYGGGLAPSAFAKIDRLKKKGVNFRYLPGLMPKHYSPKQFGIQAKRCLDATAGYWVFTTYSLWQPEPEKLWGDYLIQAPAAQYWQAMAKANKSQSLAVPDENTEYNCPGFILLTNNKFYPGESAALPVKKTYNISPNVVLYQESKESKLFDGVDYEPFGTVAWHAVKDEEISTVVDFSKPVEIQKIRLKAGHTLAALPSVISGEITVATSLDGNVYYPVGEEELSTGHDTSKAFTYNDLGIRARFVKVSMKAEDVSEHSVWAFSEIAVWGKP
jgi:hypothetical protein